ncbi:MAG TPA: histidine phosphatase family protein [Patescibacteria group bacterium]|nr:histidine phosphatase family protein [Patescibacteria group bacterium]
MPRDLILVRHGESEGNVASKRSRAGDDSLYTSEFSARHSSSWRLTDLGLRQAQTAGQWLSENVFGGNFDRHYVSSYLRALETAANLHLPNAFWRMEPHLRERDWGDLDVMTDAERKKRFARSLNRREVESLFWAPPNGESIAHLCETRVFRFLDTLHRECPDGRVVVVLHGELMWGFRVVLEHLSPQRYTELDFSEHPFDHIHNCQILHYTRVDPETKQTADKYLWMRSICPTDLTKSRNEWEPIIRRTYSNEELLKYVVKTPRMIPE